jgi:phosphoglycerate kinase
VVGESARACVERLAPGEILLLENIRFEPGETKNDPRAGEGARRLCDVYVNDAFGSAHRAHASTEGITHHVKELRPDSCSSGRSSQLNAILADPERDRSWRSSAARRSPTRSR